MSFSARSRVITGDSVNICLFPTRHPPPTCSCICGSCCVQPCKKPVTMHSRGAVMHGRKTMSPGTVSGLVILGIAFALRGTNGSSSTLSYSSASSTIEAAFPNCTSGFMLFMGDGECDDWNNNEVLLNSNKVSCGVPNHVLHLGPENKD